MQAFAGFFSLEHPLQFHFHAAGGVHGFLLFLRGLVAHLGIIGFGYLLASPFVQPKVFFVLCMFWPWRGSVY
jgi:hypothetical protein